MPRISLKSKSPEFDEDLQNAEEQICDMPGCACMGTHKAPKDRSLSQYYFFCEEHIKEYNKAWNYFEGMSTDDIETHIYNTMYGDRPTWKYGVNGNAEEALYKKAWEMYGDKYAKNGKTHYKSKEEQQRDAIGTSQYSKEYEAMQIMELSPPLTMDAIKLKYRELALLYHPDRNHGCSESEEKLKHINIAYTVLKLAYEKYDKLVQKG